MSFRLNTGRWKSFWALFSSLLAVSSFGIASIILVTSSPGLSLGLHSGERITDIGTCISPVHSDSGWNSRVDTWCSQRLPQVYDRTSMVARNNQAQLRHDLNNSSQNGNQAGRKSDSASSPHGTSKSRPEPGLMANTVPPEILKDTQNARLRESMLLGSGLEGGWGPNYAVGDQGTSFGPFQMHIGGLLTSLGGTPQQAEDPKWAVPAIMPVYANAVNQISDQEWNTNPELAAEQAAKIAEAPAQDYYAAGRPVHQVWQQTQGVLGKNPGQTGMPVTAKTTASGGNPFWNFLSGGPLAGLLSALGVQVGPGALAGLLGLPGGGTVKDWLERIGLVVFGGILVIVGILILVAPVAKAGAKEAVALRGGAKAVGLGGGEGREEAARKQAIADRSLELGEKKLALKQQRENRLAGQQRREVRTVGTGVGAK